MAYRDEFNSVRREAYWSLPRVTLFALAGLVALSVVGFVATGGDYAAFKFWAPKFENARREVFENTQSYVQGKAEYLGKLRFQYQDAEPDSSHRSSLRTLILSEAATVDNNKLPRDLQGFIANLRNQ